MKKKDYYFVAVLLSVVLASSAALGAAADVSAPKTDVDSQTVNNGNNSYTSYAHCDTTANSVMPCISTCATKTGWTTLIDHIRKMVK